MCSIIKSTIFLHNQSNHSTVFLKDAVKLREDFLLHCKVAVDCVKQVKRGLNLLQHQTWFHLLNGSCKHDSFDLSYVIVFITHAEIFL